MTLKPPSSDRFRALFGCWTLRERDRIDKARLGGTFPARRLARLLSTVLKQLFHSFAILSMYILAKFAAIPH